MILEKEKKKRFFERRRERLVGESGEVHQLKFFLTFLC